MPGVPTVFVHVGTRKSGTSYLQKALRDSRAELMTQGVDLTFGSRDEDVARQLRPLRKMATSGNDSGARAYLDWLVDRIRSNPEARHLVTQEDLADLPQEVADLYMAALAEFDVHLIVTVRHWGLTIPSEWQECVKGRQFDGTYREFIAEIRDGGPAAELFLPRQDIPGIVKRWGSSLPSGNVHVIAVGPSSRPEDGIVELFCNLVGIDMKRLKEPKKAINVSLSLPQAELLRRVNVELSSSNERRNLRPWIYDGSLRTQPRGGSIRLPDEFKPWCVEQARRQYDETIALGVDLVGRADDLLPGDDLATGPAAPDESEVLASAVRALADLGVQHLDEAAVMAAVTPEAAVPHVGRAERLGARAGAKAGRMVSRVVARVRGR